LGGQTIHRFLRITPSCHSLADYLEDFQSSQNSQILENLEILIIDEVGMLSLYFFELISDILQYEKQSGAPFGGVQLVIAGDLLQLKPISNEVTT
jgi:ATP-dependent DNA helicase PIF1